MTLWGQAKRLSRNPFARILLRLSDHESDLEPETYRGPIPETFSEAFLLSIEDDPPLFEENPYIDRIENDPILVLCVGMFLEDKLPEPSKVPTPMGWEEYQRRQALASSEARRKRNLLKQISGSRPMTKTSTELTTELETIRDRVREALLVPKDFPLLPSLEDLIRERNEARSVRAENELEIVGLEKELQKSKARESFLSMCMKAGDTPPCRNCGRIVLAGPACCEKPDIPESQPVGVPLEEYDRVNQQLEALRDLVSEYAVDKFNGDWVRGMLVKGFVPSISNEKARRERDKAQEEATQWCSLIIRLRTHLNIPHDATPQDAPRLAREALYKAQVTGAEWMREALVADVASTPEEVCQARRPKDEPPLMNEYPKKVTKKCPPHRFALRQTTGKETCIDCFVEEDPESVGLGVEQFAKNRAARRKSERAKRRSKA